MLINVNLKILFTTFFMSLSLPFQIYYSGVLSSFPF